MENNFLKIQMLVISELSGTITPEEKGLLDQLRNEYPAIKLFSDDIYRRLAPVLESALMMEIPPVEDIFEKAEQNHTSL